MHPHRMIAAPRGMLYLAASIVVAACAKTEKGVVDTTKPSAAPAATPSTASAPADTAPLIRGTVASISSTALAVKTDSGTTTIALAGPPTVYQRGNATLADVKPNSFIGVTTVKQADGSEQATEIHIFPADLRGLGEGSRMMTGASSGNRMTNGNVSDSRMTNGSVGGSTMTNGSVGGSTMTNGTASSVGSTMVVNYAGGSQTVTVPSNVTVTSIVPVKHTLAVGEGVVVPATRGADGTVSTTKVMLSSPSK